ncbi:MAG: hypothetical protein IJW23_11110 [Lentisphaeria bacterium]|nr:hypothetical protein [Lentisphaeria bacterium]
MKKICLCCALLFCVTIGLFAGPREDQEFRTVVQGIKQNSSTGMTVSADYTKRIIYVAVTESQIPAKLTAEQERQIKQAFATPIRRDANVKALYKRLGVKMVFVLVSKTNAILTIAISPNEI